GRHSSDHGEQPAVGGGDGGRRPGVLPQARGRPDPALPVHRLLRQPGAGRAPHRCAAGRDVHPPQHREPGLPLRPEPALGTAVRRGRPRRAGHHRLRPLRVRGREGGDGHAPLRPRRLLAREHPQRDPVERGGARRGRRRGGEVPAAGRAQRGRAGVPALAHADRPGRVGARAAAVDPRARVRHTQRRAARPRERGEQPRGCAAAPRRAPGHAVGPAPDARRGGGAGRRARPI
ncbi:MAG: Carbonic anhydrase, beta class, partial [uncultured Solirubrobacterales bacterium]